MISLHERILQSLCAPDEHGFKSDEYFNNGNEVDDAWLIHPGYKVVLYRWTGFAGANPATLDNSNGQYPKMFVLTQQKNRTKSFKAYYKGSDALPDITSSKMYETNISGPSD